MSVPPGKKLRTACDICHQGKMKCSGGTPCKGCQEAGYHCYYSFSQPLGRPKGTKNKRPHDMMNNQHLCNEPVASAAANTQQTQSVEPAPRNNKGDILPIFDGILEIQDVSCPFVSSNTFWDSVGFNTGDDFEHTNNAPGAAATSMDIERVAYISPAHTLNVAGIAILDTDYFNVGSDINEHEAQDRLSDLPSFSSSGPATSCDCFESHVDLLRRLKELEKDGSARLTFDAILTSARDALTPWKRLIQCSVCQNEEDQGVLILSAMSIRAILRRLQSLCLENRTHSEATNHEKNSLSISFVKIGNYEATGEEQLLVMDILILHTLGKIKFALISLRERLEQSRRKQDDGSEPTLSSTASVVGGPASYDRGCIADLLHSLESTVQVIEKSVRNIANSA